MSALFASLIVTGCPPSSSRGLSTSELERAAKRKTTVIASGSFGTPPGDQTVAGSFKIVRVDATQALELHLGPDFSTSSGPDLHLLISPKAISELTDTNATEDAENLGLLHNDCGPQIYPLKVADVGRLKTVVVHCIQYRHLFGGGAIERPAAAGHQRESSADIIQPPSQTASP